MTHIFLSNELLLLEQIGIEPLDILNRHLILENSAPSISCLSKVSNVLIDNAEDLDVVMPMYNLIKYSKSYKKQQVVYGFITEESWLTLQFF